MILCPSCYEKIKVAPNIVKTGVGIACFGGKCDECGNRVRSFIKVEVSNKNIEIKDVGS